MNTPADPSLYRRRLLRAVLAGWLIALQLLPPAAYAQSRIAQVPQFSAQSVAPNLALVIDDSMSMSGYYTPVDATYPLDVIENATTSMRAHYVNSLAYNPARHYRPWNNNGVRMPDAPYGGSGTTFNPALATPRDPRRWPDGRAIALDAGTGSIGQGGFTVTRGDGVPGKFTYPGFPGDYAQGADLFTKPAPQPIYSDVCSVTPPQVEQTVQDPATCKGNVVTPSCLQYAIKRCDGSVLTQVTAPAAIACRSPNPLAELGYSEVIQQPYCTNQPAITCSGQWVTPAPRTVKVAGPCPADKVLPNQIVGYTEYLTLAWWRGAPPWRGFTEPLKYYEIDRSRSRDYTIAANRYPVVETNYNGGSILTPVSRSRGNSQAQSASELLPGQCWGNNGDGTWCTFEQEAQNYANWFTYHRSRMFATIAVVSEVMSGLTDKEFQDLRIAIGRLNYFPGAPDPFNPGTRLSSVLPSLDGQPSTGVLERGVRSFIVGTSARQEVFDWLFSLGWVGSTPLREAVDSIGRYFSRTDSLGPWGDCPRRAGQTPASAGCNEVRTQPSQHLFCRRNFAIYATDGEWTKVNPGVTPAPQPLLENRDTAPLGGAGTTLDADGVAGPVIEGTNSATLVPRSYQYDPALDLTRAGGSAVTDVGTVADVATYYWNRDLRPDLANELPTTVDNPAFWQNLSNYFIAYGLTASMDNRSVRGQIARKEPVPWPSIDLTPSLITGGNRANDVFHAAMNSGGNFFSALDARTLQAALQSAFRQVVAIDSASTSAVASRVTVDESTLLFESGFNTSRWSGYLRAYKASDYVAWQLQGGNRPAPAWSLTDMGYTYSNVPLEPLVPLNKTTARTTTDSNRTALQPYVNELAPLLGYRTFGDSSILNFRSLQQHVRYLTGRRDWEGRSDVLGNYNRARNSGLADIVNSTPVYSGAADHAYHLGPAAAAAATSYRSYVDWKKTSRTPLLVFGTNGGLFGAVRADTGRTVFSYFPRASLPNVWELSTAGYQHRYYVDGPTIVGDVSVGGQWRTYAVGANGSGGRGLFAFDITNSATGSTEDIQDRFKWDITSAEESDLGYTISAGVIASVKDASASNGEGRWVVLQPNGYESASNRAMLLVIDLLTGDTIARLDTRVGSASAPNGLGSVTPVYDGNRNVVAVYAGDRQGNMWKFDLSSSTRSAWKVASYGGIGATPLIRVTDDSGNPQPITAAPRIVPAQSGVTVFFGTGKGFEVGDALDGQLQAIYAVNDAGSPVLQSALARLSFVETAGADGLTYRTLSNQDLARARSSAKGWFSPLLVTNGANGERVMAAPILNGGSISFTSYVPDAVSDPCNVAGSSFLYLFDIANGFSTSQFVGRDAATVGRRVTPGSLNAMAPLYFPPTGGDTSAVTSVSRSDVGSMLRDSRYRASSSGVRQTATTGTCGHVAMNQRGSLIAVQSACAGVLPLRSWRTVR